MLTLTEIRERLKTANLYRVAKATGITWQTIYRFKKGTTETLQKHTQETLSNYFKEQNNA